jgi:hypothetical protein
MRLRLNSRPVRRQTRLLQGGLDEAFDGKNL